jgi:hypothetical protein
LIRRAEQQHRVTSQTFPIFEFNVNVDEITWLRVDIDCNSLFENAVLLEIMLREGASADLRLTSFASKGTPMRGGEGLYQSNTPNRSLK